MPLEDRHDWLLVQIQEVAEALRKIAAEMLEIETKDDLGEVEATLDGLLDEQFDHARVAVIDVRTAAMILRPPARIRAYAKLLAHKSNVEILCGRGDHGRALARRALELLLEAAALEPEIDLVDRDAVAALLQIEPRLPLGARHQDLLAALLERIPSQVGPAD